MPDQSGAELTVTAVVLAGGEGRRLGGIDKPGLTVGGRSLLDHVLEACPPDVEVVVVGPARATERPVRWTREDPPGGGPVAGLAAGLREVTTPLVLLLATDLPRVAAVLPSLLTAARSAVTSGRSGAWAADTDGRTQPLVCCVLAEHLRSALPAQPRGLPLVQVLAGLALDVVPAPPGSVDDVDTPEALARIRQDGRADPTPPEKEPT